MFQKIIIRALLSLELSIAVILYVVVNLLFVKEFQIETFTIVVVAAHLPDMDLVPYFLFKDNMILKSHRIIGHHPLIILPLVGVFGYWVGDVYFGDGYYVAILVTLAVFAHFILDSFEAHGLHWLSPLSWVSLSLHRGHIRLVSWDQVKFVLNEKEQVRHQEDTGEVLSRMAPLRRYNYIMVVFAWTLFLFFVYI